MQYSEIINDIDALFVDELQDVDAEQSKVFDLVKKASAKTKFLNAEEEKNLIVASRNGDTKATEILFNATCLCAFIS